MDLDKAAIICQKHNALFHTDTVQTIAHCTFDLTNTPITFLSGSGHKFHGPKGVGFLYVRSQTNIQPFIHGGAQERNMRAGTENVAGIIGLGTALKIAYDHLEADATHMQSIKDYMVNQLTAAIPDIRFNTDLDNSLFTVLNISLPAAYSNEMTLFNLDLKGIACSGGSACSSGAAKGSHVLAAIHHPTERKAVRFSFSKYNTKAEVDEAVEKVAELAGMAVER
jgi:cysteine desulfurase